MVIIFYDPSFKKRVRKIKDRALKLRVKKQILKIINSLEISKPMRYSRKGTRDIYVPPFRLSYYYSNNKIVFLALYHKDEQ